MATLRKHKLSPSILSPSLWVLPNGGVYGGSCMMSFNQCFWISINHWFLISRQASFTLRELKRNASMDGALPVASDLVQTDLVAHHAALDHLARSLDVLLRV